MERYITIILTTTSGIRTCVAKFTKNSWTIHFFLNIASFLLPYFWSNTLYWNDFTLIEFDNTWRYPSKFLLLYKKALVCSCHYFCVFSWLVLGYHPTSDQSFVEFAAFVAKLCSLVIPPCWVILSDHLNFWRLKRLLFKLVSETTTRVCSMLS